MFVASSRCHFVGVYFLLFAFFDAQAITLNSSQTDFTTTANITTSGSAIITSLSGSSLSPNKIRNLHTLTTGNSGATSSAYGIRSSGAFYQITNDGSIFTTGSSGRGISIAGTSSAINNGTISTQKSSGFGIYASGSDNVISNSGSISAPLAYGINSEGDNSTISNSGTINAAQYAIRNAGSGGVITNSGILNGGIFLNSGTLNISGGQINGEIDGVEESVININNSTNFTQDFAFLGIENLHIKSGAELISNARIDAQIVTIDATGSLTLNTNSSLNATILGSGSLNIQGAVFDAISDINATINLAGTLNFNGANNLTIFGNLNGSGSGIIKIDEKNQNINGDFSLLDGDVLAISLKNGNAGSFDVQGLTNVEDGAILALNTLQNNQYIADGKEFIILATNGGSLNSFNQIRINDSDSATYGLLRFTTEVVGDNLVLTANRLAPSQVASSEQAQNIYAAINRIGENALGKLRQFQTYLDSLNVSREEFSQRLKQVAPNSTKANLMVSSEIANNVLRLSESRLEAVDKNKSYGFFAQPFTNSITQNAVGDDDAYKANSGGISIGFDKEISDESIYGAAISYVRSNIKSSDSLKTNFISTYQASIFYGEKLDDYFLDLLSAFAFNQYSSQRAITGINAEAQARYNGQIYMAKIKGGYVGNMPQNLKLIPEISLNFWRNNISAYEENGADSLNLKVQSVKANYAEGRIGASFGIIEKIPQPYEFKNFSAFLKASYGYNFINDQPKTQANFANSGHGFESSISQIDRASLRLGFDINAYSTDDVLIDFEYSFEKRSSLQSHLAWLKFMQYF